MEHNRSAFNSDEYDKKVNDVLPYYSQYNKQIYDIIENLELTEFCWLDTGCGTGNLINGIKDKYPKGRFVLCDPSLGMLNCAKEKLSSQNNIEFINISSQELNFKSFFDIVTSVQSHHYLDKQQRQIAVTNCYKALKDKGVYITFENIALSTKESDSFGEKRWKNYLIAHGKTPEEAEKHLARRGVELLPITINEHLELLHNTGFRSVDIIWASYMQAGFLAIK